VPSDRTISDLHSFSTRLGDSAGVGATLVSAPDIDDAIRSISREAQVDVETIAPGGAHSKARIQEAEDIDSNAFARGVRSRSIFLSSVRNDTKTISHVHWLNERGAEVRTAPVLPIRLIIIDHKTAIVPANTKNAMEGIIIHRNQGTVLALCELFEMTWNVATPLGMSRAPNGDRITVEQRTILEFAAF
jgi:hypothetical protein